MVIAVELVSLSLQTTVHPKGLTVYLCLVGLLGLVSVARNRSPTATRGCGVGGACQPPLIRSNFRPSGALNFHTQIDSMLRREP